MHKNQYYLLLTRRFLPLFVVQFLGALNDNIFKNALVILMVFSLAEKAGWNEQMVVAIAGGIFILPFFIFSATAGQIADHFHKNRIIKYVKFIEIIIMAGAAYAFFNESQILLLVILFCMGSQSAFFGPIKYSILPEYLERNELISGNAFIESATFIAILLGTIIGGLFILTTHGIPIIITLLITIAIAGWIASLFTLHTPKANPTLKVNFNIASQTGKVLQHAYSQKKVFKTILGISWFWFFGASWLTIIPIYVKEVLQANETIVTFFITLFAVSIGVGSLLCNRILHGKLTAKYVPLAGLAMSIATGIFVTINTHFPRPLATLPDYLSFSGISIALCLFGIGLFGGLFSVPLYALLQVWSNSKHRARNIAATNIMNALFMVISALFIMAIFATGGNISTALTIIALLNTFVALYIIKIIPESIIHTLIKRILKKLYKVDVHGISHFKKAGKYAIIIANHTSLLDAVLLITFLPERLHFPISTAIYKKWWIKPLLWTVDVYPIDPTRPMAVKSLVEIAKSGKKIVIFPEGRVTITGSLMKIYDGPGLIADKANAKIIPIRIDGAQLSPFSYLRGKIRTQIFPKITITIFPSFKFETDPTKFGKAARRDRSAKLYHIMTEMILQTTKTDQTLFENLIEAAKMHGRGTPILDDSSFQPISYRKLIANSFVLGKMIAQGTSPQEPIGLLIPNSKAAVVAFFGLQTQNRVAAMLNYSGGAANILSACKTAKIKHIWTSEKFIETARFEKTIAIIKQQGIEVHTLESLTNKKKRYLPLYSIGLLFPEWLYKKHNPGRNPKTAEKTATILFTSGSSGTPKGVALSHKNLNTNRAQMISIIDFTHQDKALNALPMFHSFGLGVGTLVTLFSGVHVFMYPTPLHYGIIPEIIYSQNITILFGTNTFLRGYAKRADPYDFHTIRYIFAGAEKLQESVRRDYADRMGTRILEGYGTTEASPVLSINTPMYNKLGSVGKLLPGIEYELKKVPGIEEGGNLWVRGNNIMKGYMRLKQPGVIQSPKDGWYETGDIVTIDNEGYVTIVGRAKRFAKIGAEMVSLTAVEEMLARIWPKHLSACISQPHPKKGEQLVVVTEKKDASWKALKAYAQEHNISAIAIPKIIKIMPKVPRLGSGKPDYIAIDKAYSQHS